MSERVDEVFVEQTQGADAEENKEQGFEELDHPDQHKPAAVVWIGFMRQGSAFPRSAGYSPSFKHILSGNLGSAQGSGR